MASSSLTPNLSRGLISKPIDKVRDTDVPAPWPAECVECDAVLGGREEAQQHQHLTEHEDVNVIATDEDLANLELIELTNEQTLMCITCGMEVTAQEAAWYSELGHAVIALCDRKPVN
jgi:hypothetical protein